MKHWGFVYVPAVYYSSENGIGANVGPSWKEMRTSTIRLTFGLGLRFRLGNQESDSRAFRYGFR